MVLRNSNETRTQQVRDGTGTQQVLVGQLSKYISASVNSRDKNTIGTRETYKTTSASNPVPSVVGQQVIQSL